MAALNPDIICNATEEKIHRENKQAPTRQLRTFISLIMINITYTRMNY